MTVTIATRWQVTVQVRATGHTARGPAQSSPVRGIDVEELAARQQTRRLLADERWRWERDLLYLQMRSTP